MGSFAAASRPPSHRLLEKARRQDDGRCLRYAQNHLSSRGWLQEGFNGVPHPSSASGELTRILIRRIMINAACASTAAMFRWWQ
jgi:hypothetical protein